MFHIGFELECNVIRLDTLQAANNFSNGADFINLNEHLEKLGLQSVKTEFDSATIEFTTSPALAISQLFDSLTKSLRATSEFLTPRGFGLLFLGLHPQRSPSNFIPTDKKRCHDSKQLMTLGGSYKFYTSFQVNLEVPTKSLHRLMPLCDSLQRLMWPLSIVTQSSPFYEGKMSHCKSYRTVLNDSINSARTGMLPEGFASLEAYQEYTRHCPLEESLDRQNNCWFDIMPKPLPKSEGYRVEVRHADLSSLNHLHPYAEAIALSYQALLDSPELASALTEESVNWARLDRSQCIVMGRKTRLRSSDGRFVPLNDYLEKCWRPLVNEAAKKRGVALDRLIQSLLQPSRAEEMLEQRQSSTLEELLRSYVKFDTESFLA